jgi:hypothetical protein
MKKIFIGIICLLCICGCGKKNITKKDWHTDLTNTEAYMSTEVMDIFNRATTDSTKSYKAIALLGTQVVAGTNYMFLTIEDNSSYKIIIIYNDLENNSTITSVKDFDYTKYVFENIDYNSEELAGGWSVYQEPVLTDVHYPIFDEKVINAFDKAIQKLVGVTYIPITSLGHLDEDGTKYALLCYGSLATPNYDSGIFLVTLYDQNENTKEIVSSAYIDLADFNK